MSAHKPRFAIESLARIEGEGMESAHAFLKANDTTCASLADAVLKRKKGVSVYALYDTKECSIAGMFSCSLGGTLLFCFPLPDAFPFFSPLLLSFLADKKVSCVNGSEPAASFLLDTLKALRGLPKEVNKYSLMHRPHKETSDEAAKARHMERGTGTDIVRCCSSDIDALLPLEMGFQAEDVFLKRERPAENVVRSLLQDRLSLYTVYAVRSIGSCGQQFVSKAGLNAEAFTCGQLGGVYTLAGYRRMGYGYEAVKAVVCELGARNKDCVLFVRAENEAGKALYSKAGFSSRGNYTIAYY